MAALTEAAAPAAPVVGVLALQGAFREHCDVFRGLGATTKEVRLPAHLEGLDALVLPGGESTAIAKLAERWGPVVALLALFWMRCQRCRLSPLLNVAETTRIPPETQAR